MVSIRTATSRDAASLNSALKALSRYLGDTHRATDADLGSALEEGLVHALIAEEDGIVLGAVLVSATFSTVQGCAGAYVSDLWVEESHRDQGLGTGLLEAALEHGRGSWGAQFVSLVVYDENEHAYGFYRSLGFEDHGRLLTLRAQRT